MTTPLSATITLSFDPASPGEAGAVLDAFSGLLIELQKRGVPVTVRSPAGPEPDDEPPPLGEAEQEPARTGVQQAQTGKRVRDRTAERRAAKEKAEAEAKARSRGNGAEEDPLLGAGAGPGTGDPFGDDVEDQPAPAAKPAEPRDRVRTPKECMDGAVVLLRQTWGAGGGDAVKALQKTYQVAKFADVPLDKAPGLWKEALALAQKFKVNIPAGL